MSAEDNVRVTYGVKELLGRIDDKLARIDDKLDAKADLSIVLDLLRRFEAMERREEARIAVERDRKEGFSRRERVIAAVIAAVAVVVQFVLAKYHLYRGG